MKTKTLAHSLAAAVLMAGLGACSDGTDVGNTATFTVELTDAPSDYIEAAWVDIGRVDLIASDGAPIVLSEDGTDGLVDLLQLTGTATQSIASAELEAGQVVSQIRLIVESARVKLKDGYEFNGGGDEMDLFVPSGAETGIKLSLAAADGDGESAFTVPEGETVLVIDFDVNQSFVLQGDPESPAGINSVLFTPLLRAVVKDVSSSLSGQVSTALDGVSVNGLTVTVDPVTESFLEAYETQTATAVTAGDGSAAGGYAIAFLVPGTYNVSVALPDDPAYDGLAVDPANLEVVVPEASTVTGIDFAIVQ